MKHTSKKIMQGAILFIMIFCVFTTAYALDEPYNTLIPSLPGIGGTTTFTSYIPAIINLAIGVAAVMAFVMITFGGITYATSDAISGKSQGKEYITNAIWGLLLVIGAWVILYTINPNILRLNLNPATPTTQPTASVTAGANGVPMTAEQIAADAAVRSRLVGAGVAINAGACTAGQTFGCTNLNGLPEGTVQGLIDLRSACGCNITVTGGTEAGHQTHGVGDNVVDLADSPDLRAWLTSRNYMVQGSLSAARVPLPGGRLASFIFETTGGNPNGTSTGPHWHVVI